MKSIRVPEAGKKDLLFELCKLKAIKENAEVVVTRNNQPIYSFNHLGDYQEIQVPTMKTSIAALVVERILDNGQDLRLHKANMAVLGILKSYEGRGGTL